ncbi:MAG: superoxide dismutase [Sphingomonadales bacterium]|nr:superoxide dismutase [Sphingomonadales bacterium]
MAGGALLAAAAAVPAAAVAQAAPAGGGYAPQPVPLGFDPAKVAGLSEKLLTSHHDNNYVGAVKRLGAIHAQLAGIDPASAPGFQLEGLKRAELIAWNSMILHEVYFSQFGTAGKPGGALAGAIERDFGSEAKWRAEFAGLGKALGGGSGWVVLNYSHRDNRLVNQWAADHTMSLAGGTPVLVLDMYEHAYAIDYGAKAAAYVDAVMAALDWSAADRRYARAAG